MQNYPCEHEAGDSGGTNYLPCVCPGGAARVMLLGVSRSLEPLGLWCQLWMSHDQDPVIAKVISTSKSPHHHIKPVVVVVDETN